MIKELQLLGMTRNEAIAYVALVKNGPCRARVLIDHLDTHRNIVYQTLESLIAKGYVAKVSIRGVAQFQITEPGILLTSLRRHEEIARNIIEQISAVSSNTSRYIKVHEGVDSYRRYWYTAIDRAPMRTVDYVAGGDIGRWAQFMGRDMDALWKLYVERDVEWKQLYFGISDTERRLLRDVPIRVEARNWTKPVPRPFTGNFNVIHDTVILHTVQSPPRIIEMRDDAMLPIFRNYFDMMWADAEPIKKHSGSP